MPRRPETTDTGTTSVALPWSRLSSNTPLTEDERVEEIKQAYCEDLITPERLEEDIAFVLDGGVFAGPYKKYIQKRR